MNRCNFLPEFPRTLAARRLLGACLAALSLSAAAQTLTREFPKNALRATLVVTSPPEITLDGRADRLSPGARIRSPQGALLLSGTLIGQELVVNYTLESAGLVHEVWILTPQEAQQKRAASASQDSSSYGTPVAPAVNLQLPFDQLPRYQP